MSRASRAGRNIGRKRGGSGGGGESSRTLYETYVKKLSQSFFNDITVKLQSGDIDIGSDSFIEHATKAPSDIKKRKVSTWGIMPTRIALSGIGDHNGSYVIKEIRNQLDRSGGFQANVGLLTTDEFLQKGVRATHAILSALGVGFLEKYISKFRYQVESSIKIRNVDIAYNLNELNKDKEGDYEDKGYSGYAVISADSKGEDTSARLTLEIRKEFGFDDDLTSHMFERGRDDISVAYNAMNDNMMMHAQDTYTEFVDKETVGLEAEGESELPLD